MIKLKSISNDGVPAALKKAEWYRLLNEPLEAESICLDILEVDPENQQALVVLVLAYTDQLAMGTPHVAKKAQAATTRFSGDYEKNYYAGIISERRAKATLKTNRPGCDVDAYEWFQEAMALFEKAEALRVAGNEDAILRWNTCVRIIADRNLRPREEDNFVPFLE